MGQIKLLIVQIWVLHCGWSQSQSVLELPKNYSSFLYLSFTGDDDEW